MCEAALELPKKVFFVNDAQKLHVKGQASYFSRQIYLSRVQISRAPTYCVLRHVRKCPKTSFAKIIFSRTWRSMISTEAEDISTYTSIL